MLLKEFPLGAMPIGSDALSEHSKPIMKDVASAKVSFAYTLALSELTIPVNDSDGGYIAEYV
jgi:hypothetical protein